MASLRTLHILLLISLFWSNLTSGHIQEQQGGQQKTLHTKKNSDVIPSEQDLSASASHSFFQTNNSNENLRGSKQQSRRLPGDDFDFASLSSGELGAASGVICLLVVLCILMCCCGCSPMDILLLFCCYEYCCDGGVQF